MRKWLLRGMPDGVLHGLLLWVMYEGMTCAGSEKLLEVWLVIPLAAAAISAGGFAWGIRRAERDRQIAGMSAVSVVCFLLTMAAWLLVMVEGPGRLLPARELGMGDGILLLFATEEYLVAAGSLRALMWVIRSVWNSQYRV